jgi:hypothetical protein
MNRNLKTRENLNDKVKVEMVSADQMTDAEREAVFNREESVDSIPDLDILTGHIFDILTYLEKPQTINLMKTNQAAVKMYLNNKYADSIPLGIITLLMEEDNKDENIERLMRMFESLRKAKGGKLSLEEAKESLIEDVSQRYLYSDYGGSKEAFEKALMMELQKEQQKKNKQNVENLKNVGKVRFKN